MPKNFQRSSEELPKSKYLRISQILKLIPMANETWWKGVNERRFPQPVKFKTITLWRTKDIQKLIETKFISEKQNLFPS